VHGGAGVRKLKERWYEVRSDLDLRLIFRDCDECLSFEFMGNHDEVRRFLKGVN
jgi:ribosomal protein S27AE